MSGKQPITDRRKVVSIGDSVGFTLPAKGLDEHDIDPDDIESEDVYVTLDEDGKFYADLSDYTTNDG